LRRPAIATDMGPDWNEPRETSGPPILPDMRYLRTNAFHRAGF
jgi:hypothetical protein